jgi:hypothetical protein
MSLTFIGSRVLPPLAPSYASHPAPYFCPPFAGFVSLLLRPSSSLFISAGCCLCVLLASVRRFSLLRLPSGLSLPFSAPALCLWAVACLCPCWFGSCVFVVGRCFGFCRCVVRWYPRRCRLRFCLCCSQGRSGLVLRVLVVLVPAVVPGVVAAVVLFRCPSYVGLARGCLNAAFRARFPGARCLERRRSPGPRLLRCSYGPPVVAVA